MRAKIAIIGGGPAGLLLSQILHRNDIDSIVLEKRSREYVMRRIRAGVLEWGSVQVLRDAGVGERMNSEGRQHNGTAIVWSDSRHLWIDTKRFTGKQMMAYGQTAITEDLYAARDRVGGKIIDKAESVAIHAVDTNAPYVTFVRDGESHRIDCEIVAGCDGFHGVSRKTIPGDVVRTYKKNYPFGWLGILSETPPMDEIVYAIHERGFALASQRGPNLSRYYLQCPLGTNIDDWHDDRFWQELKARFPEKMSQQIVTGPSIEKSITPLRSFVVEPMSYGRLHLAGDAAHILPPTGAKGLNLAISDVHYLSKALVAYFEDDDDNLLQQYSATALKRVWSAARLSWYLTSLLHRFPDQGTFDLRMQENELEFLAGSETAMENLAEQYVGLPF